MAVTLRTIGLFGLFLFCMLYAATYLSTDTIEHSAKNFILNQIEFEVRQQQARVTDSTLAEKAKLFGEKLGLETEAIIKDLEDNLPERIAARVAAMCGYECERQKQIAQSITQGYLNRLTQLSIAENTLEDVIKGKYLEIVHNLKTDLRIFNGSNAALFLLIVLVSFFKPAAIKHLFMPGLLLFTTTILSSAIYVFGQDWFYAILYNDYMGFAYLGYVSLIFGLLLDIVLNKARVTSEIINAIGKILGEAFAVSPC